MDVLPDRHDQEPGVLGDGPPAVPYAAGQEQCIPALQPVRPPSASTWQAPETTYISSSLRCWYSRPASWSPVNSSACSWWCPRTRGRTPGTGVSPDSSPARTRSTVRAVSDAASSSTAVVSSASATRSRDRMLGRARSFSIWLRKGTDRPLRADTAARVRWSARRRLRTATPTRSGSLASLSRSLSSEPSLSSMAGLPSPCLVRRRTSASVSHRCAVSTLRSNRPRFRVQEPTRVRPG